MKDTKTSTLGSPPAAEAVTSGGTSTVTTTESSSTAVPPVKPRGKRWRMLPLVLIAAVLLSPWLTKHLPSGTKTAPGGWVVDWNQRPSQIQADLMKANSGAAQEVAIVWQDFGRRLEGIQKQNHKETSNGVDSAVNSLVQADQIGWLIAEYAQDQVLGGDRAQARVDNCSSEFTRALKNSSARTCGLVAGLQQELAAVNNRYARAVGEIIDQQGPSLPRARFAHLAELRQQVPFRVTIQVDTAAVATTFEVATARTTKAAVVKVTQWLALKLAPQIAKAGVGASAAVVDGPLPFGDIVTVGLAAWTVYDVATLPGQIRSEVMEQFQNVESAHHKMLDTQVKASMEELSKKSGKAREMLHNELLASLK